MKCKTCKFYVVGRIAGQGHCYFNPPQPYIEHPTDPKVIQLTRGQALVKAVRPPVKETEWCGQHQDGSS